MVKGDKLIPDDLSWQAQELRPEIAQAWRRAHLGGLDPGMQVREPEIVEVDRRSQLMRAAGPVLDAMFTELADTSFSVVVADRNCAVVDRRLGSRSQSQTLDRVMVVPGARYVERCAGTNSLATAFELNRPIAVTGDEHFLDALKVFCCYGAPIVNQVTRRLEGVLDVTGPANETTDLLGPFVRRAVRDIEIRLLEGARSAERQLLAAFQEYARHKRHAVLVVSESLVLSNPTANDLVCSADHARLQALVPELQPTAVVAKPLTLTSGVEVMVHARQVVGTGGVLFDIVKRGTARNLDRHPDVRSGPTVQQVVAVVGEPGTGRTRAAHEIADSAARFVDCGEALSQPAVWIEQAVDMVGMADGHPLVIDNVHLLDSRIAAMLTPAIRSSDGLVVVTSSPPGSGDFEHAALLAAARDRHELRPVRTYGPDFGDLAIAVLSELYPGHSLRIAPSAMQVLAVQQWPGNIKELQSVLSASARDRRQGDIIAADLPVATRARVSRRRLSLLEVVERDAIEKALGRHNGNKSAAAAELGIGRTTLYQRLRRFEIDT